MIFANYMQDKKSLNKFWKKALRKYRFVIMTDDSFEEKLSVRLSRLNIFAFAGFVVFFCFFMRVKIKEKTVSICKKEVNPIFSVKLVKSLYSNRRPPASPQSRLPYSHRVVATNLHRRTITMTAFGYYLLDTQPY